MVIKHETYSQVKIIKEFYKSINLNDFKHTAVLPEGTVKGSEYGNETKHNYTNWDLMSEFKAGNSSVFDFGSAIDKNEKQKDPNEKIIDENVTKEFYKNIKKNPIIVRPNKKLREFPNVPGYFRIIENTLAPTPWVKDKSAIKEDLIRKGQFDVRFFSNPIDYFDVINNEMTKKIKLKKGETFCSGSLQAKRRKFNKKRINIYKDDTPEELKRKLTVKLLGEEKNEDYDGMFNYDAYDDMDIDQDDYEIHSK